MKWNLGLALCLLTLAAGPALAEDVEGLVRVVGRSFDAQTLITPEKQELGTLLCRSEIEQRIRRLTPLVVKVSGQWKHKKGGDPLCFQAAAFSVLRMASGRDALVGVVSAKGDVVSLETAGGKVVVLSEVPPGLKKLVGQKVIVDVKAGPAEAGTAVQAAQAKDPAVANKPANVVITYQPFP